MILNKNKFKTMKKHISLFLGLKVLFSPALFAAIVYVNPTATGLNNGTSWVDAYTNLSVALSSASSGDELWIARGVYKPETQVDVNSSGGPDLQEACFQIPNNIKIFGGFTGTETARNERDWNTNLTILSGDIDNNDVNTDGNFISESAADIVGSNAYHVVYTANVSHNTVVDGFIITGGNAKIADPADVTDQNRNGGGWYNYLTTSGSPTIVNCTFQGNYADVEGGAIFNSRPNGGTVLSVIRNCSFIKNKSGTNGGAIALGSFQPGNYGMQIIKCKFNMNEAYRRGGALYFVGDHASIDSSLFFANKVTVISEDASTLPGSGGGVNLVASNSVFNNCIFEHNSATGNPTGAFEGGGGGAVYASINDVQTAALGASEPKFYSCGFYRNTASGNTAAWGGAVVHLSDAGILKPVYVNCVFAGNEAFNHGGAVASFARVISGPEGFIPVLNPEYTNCTFYGNHAGNNGGAVYNLGYVHSGTQMLNARIENCIIWGNVAGVSGANVFSTGSNLILYSLVEGSGGSGAGWNASMGTDGGNNIDVGPDFVNDTDPDGPDNIPANTDDGLRLTNASPAVNAGNNAAPGLAGITKDYIGNLRVLGSQVDIGAYETQGFIIPDFPKYRLFNWRKEFPQPPCLTCPPPWSFVFSDFKLPRYFVWQAEPQLLVYEDSAIVKGQIVDSKNNNSGFLVYLKLVNPVDWKEWRKKKRTYLVITPEALKVAKTEHVNWTYYLMSNESYLQGFGNFSGRIELKHYPANKKLAFQFGKGANGWDGDLGLGGTFAYNSKLKYKNKNINVRGVGSINADAELCGPNCLNMQNPVTEEWQEKLEEVALDISIHPLPAKEFIIITFNQHFVPGNYAFEIHDLNGYLKKQFKASLTEGKYEIKLGDLSPGFYYIKLIHPEGKPLLKTLILK